MIQKNSIRPVQDEVGFCWNRDEMESLIEYLSSESDSENENESENLIAAISPHDDYLYAGKVYYPLYKLIKAKEVVIFGVTHGSVRRELNNPHDILIFDDYEYWKGLSEDVKVSRLRSKIIRSLDKDDYMISNRAHDLEHSIEALIPFLQYYNPELKITPIMVTQTSFEKMDKLSDKISEVIAEYIEDNKYVLGKDVVIMISSDANHYGEDFDNSPYGEDENAHKMGTDNDRRIADKMFNGILNKDKVFELTDEIWENDLKSNCPPLWCGRYSIPLGLLTTLKIVENVSDKEMRGEVYKYSDSLTEGVLPMKNSKMGTTALASAKHWCGWFSAGFYIK